ncbi:MAG: hypothetical protein HAW59_02190, partial [Betaproteobacteria bacterium]|nr:hypothetical protein [Betaproteobacteria bacterium]
SGGKFAQTTDIGFRAFALAESAFLEWRGTEEATPESWKKAQKEAINLLPNNGNEESLLYEVMLAQGYAPDSKAEKLKIGNNTVWEITDYNAPPDTERMLHVCLDSKLADNLHIKLGLNKTALLIVRDSALTDSLAASIAMNCRLSVVGGER